MGRRRGKWRLLGNDQADKTDLYKRSEAKSSMRISLQFLLEKLQRGSAGFKKFGCQVGPIPTVPHTKKAPRERGFSNLDEHLGLGQCGFRLFDNTGKRVRLVHSQVGQNLAVYFDAGL